MTDMRLAIGDPRLGVFKCPFALDLIVSSEPEVVEKVQSPTCR